MVVVVVMVMMIIIVIIIIIIIIIIEYNSRNLALTVGVKLHAKFCEFLDHP